MEVLPVALAAILTFASPFIAAIINNPKWTYQAKSLTALALSLIIAVVYLALSGQGLNWADLATTVPLVFSIQQLTYNFLVRDITKTIEQKTTPTSTEVVVVPVETTPDPDTEPSPPAPYVEDETPPTQAVG